MNDIRQGEHKFKNFIGKCMKIIQQKIIIEPSNYICDLSTEEEDTTMSFDMVYESKINISVRLRTNRYINYDDVTIRYQSNGGGPTEYHKIKVGYGHIYFYGWLDVTENFIERFVVYDISKIRNDIDKYTSGPYQNLGDNTKLVAYKLDFLKSRNALIVEVIKYKGMYRFKYERNQLK